MTALAEAPGLVAFDGGLPHDLEAERAVLGALMLDERAVVTVRDLLQPKDFLTDTSTSTDQPSHSPQAASPSTR
jgi:hypothetical protein